MEQKTFDAIVVGAGAAELMATWELVQTGKTVAILEAKNRIDGRVDKIEDKKFNLFVKPGAEFVHGDLELTQMLLKKASAAQNEAIGDLWQKHEGELREQKDFIKDYSALKKKFKELRHDNSVAEFISDLLQEDQFEELRFCLKNYVEGYYAANTRKANIFTQGRFRQRRAN